MKKICLIFTLLIFSMLSVNSFAQDDGLKLGISWSDFQAAILDSISGAKYVLAGVDVDQDGKQEFIVPIDYGILNGIPTRQIAVFEAVGNNNYELAWKYTYPGEAAGELVQPAVGDLDGDGNLEILGIHVQPDGVDPALPNFYVFECKGDNDYGTEPTVAWDMNDNRRNNIRCAAAYDLDNDGKMEVILTDNKGPVVASVS
ncbi:VCBS repeat-containing protein, partial [bacterium]|nr:VCBS repeat-containing protein [bacterium]